jgi:hypothetical protein
MRVFAFIETNTILKSAYFAKVFAQARLLPSTGMMELFQFFRHIELNCRLSQLGKPGQACPIFFGMAALVL